MLKIFCDNCGSDNAATTSRRIEHLVKDDGKDLGIEIILLHHDGSSPDHHLCADCFASFLIAAAKTFVGTATMAKHEKFLSQAIDYDLAVSRLNEKEEALAARDADLAKKTAALKQAERVNLAKMVENDEKVKVMAAQLAAVRTSTEQRVKQAVAEVTQKTSDQANDPAYLEAVAKREALRMKSSVEIPKVIPTMPEGEDPAYIEAVRKREAIRASGRR